MLTSAVHTINSNFPFQLWIATLDTSDLKNVTKIFFCLSEVSVKVTKDCVKTFWVRPISWSVWKQLIHHRLKTYQRFFTKRMKTCRTTLLSAHLVFLCYKWQITRSWFTFIQRVKRRTQQMFSKRHWRFSSDMFLSNKHSQVITRQIKHDEQTQILHILGQLVTFWASVTLVISHIISRHLNPVYLSPPVRTISFLLNLDETPGADLGVGLGSNWPPILRPKFSSTPRLRYTMSANFVLPPSPLPNSRIRPWTHSIQMHVNTRLYTRACTVLGSLISGNKRLSKRTR